MHTKMARLDCKSDPHTLFDNLDLLIDDGLILVDPNREVVRANQSSLSTLSTRILNQPLEYFCAT